MFMIALHGRLWFCLTWDVFVCVLIVGWFYVQVKVQRERERDCEVKWILRSEVKWRWVAHALCMCLCICFEWKSYLYGQRYMHVLCEFWPSMRYATSWTVYIWHTHEIGIGIVIVICIVCNKEKRKCRKITKFLGFPKRYPDSIWVIKERICGIQLLLIFLYLLLPGITIKLLKTQSHIVE